MSGSAQPDPLVPEGKPAAATRVLAEPEWRAALQLLVERARFVTGATGAALALPRGDEMVCQASAGSCAPPVGISLQVRSGLTGESIARRQLLRCDNTETDARVNLETCRAMGIASIIVMPLVRGAGEVRGLFELFSDHANAFEERDLAALEHLADLTLTALDLAEGQAKDSSVQVRTPEAPTPSPQITKAGPAPVSPWTPLGKADLIANADAPETVALQGPSASSLSGPAASPAPDVVAAEALEEPVAASVPEAMRRVQRCASCGFPVSEGRTLCLDCEKGPAWPARSAEPVPPELVPGFLSSAPPPPKESWLANHVNLLALAVLILGILVAVVVFR